MSSTDAHLNAPQPNYAELLTLAVEVVSQAAEIALNPPEDLDVETKSHRNDLVTVMDKRVEEFVTAALAEKFDYPMIGEEGHSAGWEGRVWVLDPIDGTMNYVCTRRDWAISLALCEDGEPVLGVVADPVLGVTYTAIHGAGAWVNGVRAPEVPANTPLSETLVITGNRDLHQYPALFEIVHNTRGLRRYGASALECIEVALGHAGCFVHSTVAPWDVCAAYVFARECGAVFSRVDGEPFNPQLKGSILLGWPLAHDQMLTALSSPEGKPNAVNK